MSAATQETYNKIKLEGLANGNTPDETQDTSGIRLCYAWKGYRSRASIYERMLPDKLTTALCLDGPVGADNAMTFHNDGRITVMTGTRDPNLGASSGRLNISTFGGMHNHKGRVNMVFSEGDDTKNEGGDGQALNIYCSGDYVEQTEGGERFIKAKTILIEATEDLVIKGGSVKIQSDSDIEMAGSAINTVQVNKKDIVLGQKMSFGAGEETCVQFDPRANSSIVSPGHINRVIGGDYKKFITGVSSVTVAGVLLPGIPLVKDRSASYNVKTLLGNTNFNTVVGATLINTGGAFLQTAGGVSLISAGGNASLIAGGAANVTAAGAATMTAGAAATVTAGGAATLSAGAAAAITAGAAVAITAVGDVSMTGANVRLTGALIYLN
tara:strand:+ start:4507 stop:5655 length:1149 start_codon:yes stop_codon:yes gene_type:complete